LQNQYLSSISLIHLFPKSFNSGNENFITLFLFLCLILYTLSNILFFRRLNQILKSFFNQSAVNQLTRDGNILNETISLLLYINYFIAFAMLLFITNKQILKINIYNLDGIYQYLIILAVVILFFSLKIITIKFIGFVFKTRQETSDYMQLLFIFNQITGIVLIPILIIAVYAKIKSLIYVSFILIALLLMFKVIRIILNRISPTKFSVFYLFLYLCTIEILPILVFIKMIYSRLLIINY
jgi:hypothetical protein